MVEDGRHAAYGMTVCSEVPSSTDSSGVEGNRMEVVLQVSFELTDGWSVVLAREELETMLHGRPGCPGWNCGEGRWRHVQEVY